MYDVAEEKIMIDGLLLDSWLMIPVVRSEERNPGRGGTGTHCASPKKSTTELYNNSLIEIHNITSAVHCEVM